MEILNNENLAKYTTFKLGGTAKKMYFPESTNDLAELKNRHVPFKYIIGGGSNLLINESRVFPNVINIKKLNLGMSDVNQGKIYVGASVPLQKVIKEVNKQGYGGIEYLYSVPGLVGGAIYMNAGRGRKYNQSISDYLVSVDYYYKGDLIRVDKNNCNFRYRDSIFHDLEGAIIIGAHFNFEEISQEESKKRIQERIQLCKEVQDMSCPNFGSVFSKSDKLIIRMIKVLNLGNKEGVCYSSKARNWMLHRGNGTFNEAHELIKKVEKAHNVTGRRCRVEVKIWD